MDRTNAAKLATRLIEVAVLVVFVLLLWQNHTLRRHVAAAGIRSANAFVPGDVLKTVPVLDATGRRTTLDLRESRTIVAVVDPRCESCTRLIASLPGLQDARVLSLAPPAETKGMADAAGIAPITYAVPEDLRTFETRKLRVYPQLFVVDRGNIVRTCATLAECR